MALAVLLAAMAPAAAASWPSKPVRVIVPFAPGSTPDNLARIIAEKLQAKFGQPFVVENKPGASGNLGTDAVAKAEPDGTTIGVSIVGPLVLNALLFPKLPYDPQTDLAPITVVITQPSVLVVSNALGVDSFPALADKLRSDGAKLNYGSIGYGSLSHLSMIAITRDLVAKPQHLPFAGSPAVVTALTRNDVQMAVLPAISVAPQAQAGKMKMLAVTSAKRSVLLPELPTLGVFGLAAAEAGAWNGLISPAGTPADIQARLREAVVKICRAGLDNGGFWHERYHPLQSRKVGTTGPRGYCEYPAVLTRIVLGNPAVFGTFAPAE